MTVKYKHIVSCLAASALTAGSAHAASVFDMGAGLVSLEFVTVGDAGNADHSSGFGGVDYTYRISKHEVTNAQYAMFLNAVEPQNTKLLFDPAVMGVDPRSGIYRTGNPPAGDGEATEENRYRYHVTPGMENLPVNFVSKVGAAQFVNWLHNGQPTIPLETGWKLSRQNHYTYSGAYQFDLTTYGQFNHTRLEGAQYFIPSEDEWFKAAFYQPGADGDGYWDYATATNAQPAMATVDAGGNVTNGGGNVANYGLGADWGVDGNNIPLDGNLVDVGTSGGASYYGTYDQNGNVLEMTETIENARMVGWGGSWQTDAAGLASSREVGGDFYNQWSKASTFGFRVAAVVPEPAGFGLLGIAGIVAMRRRTSRRV